VNIITWRGSVNAMSDGKETRVYVSRNWRGTIHSPEPIVVYRERGWLDRQLARLKARFRRG
jgi:hypothetical protein